MIKITTYVIDSHLVYIIIKDLKESKFSENPKTVLVRPIYKKDDRDKINKSQLNEHPPSKHNMIDPQS